RLRRAGVDAADLVPEADVGRRAGARRLADGRLIHFEHAVDVLDATHGAAPDQLRGRLRPLVAGAVAIDHPSLEIRVQDIARDRGLAGARDTRDHHEPAERNADIGLAHVVQLHTFELQ